MGGTQSATDLRALIARTACEGRAGRWTDGKGCIEYVTLTCPGCPWTSAKTSCPSGRHMCTVLDMYYAGFRSIDAQGLRKTAPRSYMWLQGFAGNNQIYYPWGLGEPKCTDDAAPMFFINAGGNPLNAAFGCYLQSYADALAPCCLD
jgi:hypothetical protein